MAFAQVELATTDAAASIQNTKPTVVGIYGISGCGKSFLLNHLSQNDLADLGDRISYYDGSAVINAHVHGGLAAFKSMQPHEQDEVRNMAIRAVAQGCDGRVGIVAGHFLFWDIGNGARDPPPSIWTSGDAETYTHILYLKSTVEIIASRRQNDSLRKRPALSVEHLERWQEEEIRQLRETCLRNGILFSEVPQEKVSSVLRDIVHHTEAHNLSLSRSHLDTICRSPSFASETVLLLDGDKTLIEEDTGALFVQLMLGGQKATDPLKTIFSSSAFGYSYAAFRQVALFFDSLPEHTFIDYCQQVADAVSIRPEFMSLLAQAARSGVGAIVVTCGIQRIWERIIARANLSESVKVVGGGRVSDESLVITGEVKGVLAQHLQDVHCKFVCAFGDSVLDLPMLKAADRAIIVVGDENTRSRSMEGAVRQAIEEDKLIACQLVFPRDSKPRLDLARLPKVDITSDHFLHSVVCPMDLASDAAAKLLMTPMRDATMSGPALRRAHAEVGRHLALNLLSERIGLETYPTLHVQGHLTDGYRFCGESRILIVPLMRGGEPMAFGISEAMPTAMFLHAKEASDLKNHHIEGLQTIILVDSVVNTGKSLVPFIRRIREVDSCVRIAIVVGVIQAKALSRSIFSQTLAVDSNVCVVALRRSDNKFTGRGGTDTGNRLFNTTHID
ncbi:hypothetical protein CYLTODRAFT_453691 [Cylindrobasidium torrendii FP15055 ss-10]|uniref:Phosphoribosyltransferase domain-containing protein n=1 Tax=Cylindrobasidium torrendii FP15055 ss-10 TaxID=1314674 RepID=A0A0D7BCK7_9AGAR|nr:hypothetical protein CYLTODRAFT_453691 [Cylindrobasidium torrendii FP15055 ss-10]